MQEKQTSEQRGGLLAGFAAVGSALVASACCIGPLVLAGLGAGGATFAAALSPYRPYFLGLTAVFLGVAFYFAYRRRSEEACRQGETCAAPKSRRRIRVTLWMITVLAVGLSAYPYLAGAGANQPVADDALQTVELDVRGMTCDACANHVRSGLENVEGVTSATVLYPEGEATVYLSTRQDLGKKLIEAVQEAGYEASVRENKQD